MTLENKQNEGFDCTKEFFKVFDNSKSINYLDIPSSLGEGFMKRVDIMDGLWIMFHLSKINEKLIIKKIIPDHPMNQLIFRFIFFMESDKNYLSSVQVSNICDVNYQISPKTNVCCAVICIESDILLNLLDLEKADDKMSSFISNFENPFLFQEILTLEMKNILLDLSKHRNDDKFERLFFKTKISELIYEFFSVLFTRASRNFTYINRNDIEKILGIEKLILNDLCKTPALSELARTIGMSETKMKLLFKKIFGNSIYNYYSSARMIEAASILKNDKNISVSEVGYRLGFSSLSHFSKMFKKHIGMKPKEYALKTNKR
ncbi:MAG: AraC family transcriptional regulator [Tannerellaceae bacterium]|jgi:AraC-like DNA-binding protein|nr:AraC family transcriptional regulator [Tannerellaceae bacterium]